MTVFGEPCSKANSRKVAMNKATGRKLFIKSKGAREYCESFLKQVGDRRRTLEESGSTLNLITCNVLLHCNMFYASRRKDLDESLVMDMLQNSGIIKNDRLIRQKSIYWFLDKARPRVEITLYELEGEY
ncbi:MAG: hypothetical protein D8M57_13100 [Candidatus Scalindua sp. AMX11]|nr:MAG: hypothetical protein DWQ00_11990 [Candidatus Scalindua sp.]TDE64432.1 MAG: hypothetical protein D8M57_13100 [Candidatus Scalindua sp. AMX11]